jgi:hypothetical protein
MRRRIQPAAVLTESTRWELEAAPAQQPALTA